MTTKTQKNGAEYIGMTIEEVRARFSTDYPSYCLIECDDLHFYQEIYYPTGIRALVENGKVIRTQQG